MAKSLTKAAIGVLLGLLFTISVGIFSALTTKDRYQFDSNYPGIGHERLSTVFTHGRIKMQFLGYNTADKITISKQFYGIFLRYGAHYLVLAKEQDTAENRQSLTARSFYIVESADKAAYISDQRGVFITKDNQLLNLNSVLLGKPLTG
ncbi:hypothetical protein PTW35_08940 [Photobacterium sp. DA100]|uniref:hypothetical protein n=1 Tax=Photobacterium sp. DA100 TaxID=3027472 RepID=UPI002479F70F|nr:hypothetical protein [Photobacterium sp. DA100]WEM43882.1 hypothetical protein PTW35_08940 [Photobacterium sp. DA100]